MKTTRVFPKSGDKSQSVVMRHPAADTPSNDTPPAGNPSPRPNRWPIILAAVASLIWLGTAAYLVNLNRINWIETGLTLQGAAMLLTGALSPVMLVWLITLAFSPFQRRGSEPDATQNRADSLRQSIDEIDAASQRINNLEARFEEQIKSIHDVTALAETRTATIQKTLSDERAGLEKLIAEMDHRATEMRVMAQSLAETLRSAAGDARAEARAAGETLTEHASLLAVSSRQTIENIKEISSNLAAHTTRLHETSLVAEQAVARIGNSVGDQEALLSHSLNALTVGTEKLRTETSGTQAALVEQLTSLEEIARQTTSSLSAAVTDLATQTDRISTTAATVNDRLDGIGARMESHDGAMRAHVESLEAELTRAESSAAARSRQLDEITKNVTGLVDNTLARMNSQSTELGEGAKSALEEFEKSASKLEARMKELRQAATLGAEEIQQTAKNLKDELSTTLSESGEAMGHLLENGSRLKEDQSELVTRYDMTIEKIREIASTLEQQMAEVTQAAANAEAQAGHVGILLATGAQDLENAASGAASAAEIANQTLAAQTEGLIRAAADIEKSSDELTALTARLEDKVSARSHGEFARTSSFVIEALASQAIDIHRVLETDVPDTVWQKYLKGDRSIFARRTVRIGNRQTRELIERKFRNDGEFREHVERYIKEFEKLMAYAISADPQGPLSVTLVSSEMGKLYVLLAQSLNRLE